MLGKRSAQRGLFEADVIFADFVGQRSFYGYLGSQQDELFQDEDFAALYCRDNGRPSVPPSLLADGVVQVLRALAKLATCDLMELAEEVGCTRYVHGPSLKGQADVDWSDPTARQRFLAGIVADAEQLLELVRGTRAGLEEHGPEDQELVAAAELLATTAEALSATGSAAIAQSLTLQLTMLTISSLLSAAGLSIIVLRHSVDLTHPSYHISG